MDAAPPFTAAFFLSPLMSTPSIRFASRSLFGTSLMGGVLAAGICCIEATGQTPTRIIRSSGGSITLIEEVTDMEIGMGAGAQDPAKSEDEPAAPPILPQFQQIVFDRRPSTILKVWAEPLPEKPVFRPPPRDPAPKPDTEKPGDGNASSANEAKPAVNKPATEPVTPPTEPVAEPSAKPTNELKPAIGTAAGEWLIIDPNTGEESTPMSGEDVKPGADGVATAANADAKPAEQAKPADPYEAKLKAAKTAFEAKLKAWELKVFARDVTLGRWEEVKTFIAGIDEKERGKAYDHLLGALAKQPPPNGQVPPNMVEKHSFEFSDLFGLAAVAPGTPAVDPKPDGATKLEREGKPAEAGISDKQVARLAPIAKQALARGDLFEVFVTELKAETAKPNGEGALSKRRAAQLLGAMKRDIEMGSFLDRREELEAAGDREGLNLLARNLLAKHAKDEYPEDLTAAWDATLATLELPAERIAGTDKPRAEALTRAVTLAPQLQQQIGMQWLENSFTSNPERGMEILATIGAKAGVGFEKQPQNAKERLQTLKLQGQAVEALLERAPERAAEWKSRLELMATLWMREAEHAYANSERTNRGPRLRYDEYGNSYWSYGGSSNTQVKTVDPDQLLDCKPTGKWRGSLDASLQPKFDRMVAQLHLKLGEEDAAFPYIEALATSHPEKGKELAEEFLRVWTKNHNPNQSRRYTNSYMFNYGYSSRSDGIPLTRSKQERNLEELASWMEKIRKLPIKDLDATLIAGAFKTSHSAAEVWDDGSLQRVFGGLDNVDAKVLTQLVTGMRENLLTIWRRPSVQEDNKTNRKQKDLEREVMQGYVKGLAMTAMGLQAHDDYWGLRVVQGALMHDLNNYRAELKKDSGFASDRAEALDVLEQATMDYIAGLDALPRKDESGVAFQTWVLRGCRSI